jgi:hypothetical protein
MNDETFHAYMILADKFYAGKNPNAGEWTESFIVTGFVRLQGALDWIADVAKENGVEQEDGGWIVTLMATQKERREYGLLETTYTIEQVEMNK